MPRTSQRTVAKSQVNGLTDYDSIMAEYKQRYNVDTLDSPNDIANLRTMIRNQILIAKLQAQMETLSDGDVNAGELKKILDSIVALSEVNVTLERTLGIDRKTRKNESSQSTADYIMDLRARAREFLDDPRRITKVMCKDCGILVGRISGVYDSTSYQAAFQCPQCNKMITISRKERDIFHGVKDAEWRKKYPIEIVNAKKSEIPTFPTDTELIIGDDEDAETEIR